MPETYPSDAQINAQMNTTLPGGILVPDTTDDPHYTAVGKMWWRIDRQLRALGLEVYKDGALTFAVRSGRFLDGVTVRNYAGATGQSLTDDATNYIYLTLAAALTKNTTGFPSTPHIPLATIVTASGAYDPDTAVTDYRGRSIFQPAGGLTVTAGAESSDKRTLTIQGGSHRQVVDVWIATADYGAPSATGNTVAIDTGTILETITANAHYRVISDATGKVDVGITISGAATRYILAQVDGRIYSSGQVDWAA